jgi:hypothetical protein
VADHCQFDIVDHTGAIHADALENALFHPIDQNGVQSDLDGMCSHAEEDHPLSTHRVGDPRHHFSEIFSRKDFRQGVDKIT